MLLIKASISPNTELVLLYGGSKPLVLIIEYSIPNKMICIFNRALIMPASRIGRNPERQNGRVYYFPLREPVPDSISGSILKSA